MADKRALTVLTLAAVVFTGAVMAIAAWKWAAFGYNAMDLAYFAQAAWNGAHGRFFAFSIHPGTTLGDHAEWLLAPLGLVYAVIPHPLTLVFLQAAAIAASAFVLWRIARRSLPPSWALGAAVAFLLLPSAAGMALFEFHVLVFALPLLLLAADAYLEKRLGRFALFLGLALLVREDVALPVFCFGLVALVERRPWKWVMLPTVFATAWFAAMLQVIRRFSIGGDYKFFAYYGWLWPFDPGALAQHLLTLPQLEFLVALLMPLLFLPLVRPKWLVLSLPGYLQVALASWGAGAQLLGTHYLVLLLPGVLLAGIQGLSAVLTGTLPAPLRFLAKDRRAAALALGTAVLFSAATLGPFARGAWITATERVADAPGRALALIPDDASVAASERFLPALAHREDLIALRYLFLGITQYGSAPYDPPPPDFIIYDEDDLLAWHASFPTLGWTRDRYRPGFGRLRALIDNAAYGVVFRDGGVTVWRRGADRPRLSGTVERSVELTTDIRLAASDAPALCPGRTDGCPTLLLRPNVATSDDLLLRIAPATGEDRLMTFGVTPTFTWSAGQTAIVPVTISPSGADFRLTLVSAEGLLLLDPIGRTVVAWRQVEERSPAVPISPAALAAPPAAADGTP